MNLRSKHVVPGLLLLAAIGAAASSASPGQSSSAPSQHPAASAKAPVQQDEGQRVFEQNCGRCHTPPDGFPPRISGTIVRHMRVRANLSRHDEEVLLRYFNP